MSFLDDIGLGGETEAERRAKQNGEVLFGTGSGTDDIARRQVPRQSVTKDTPGAMLDPSSPTGYSLDPYAGTPYEDSGFNEVWDGATGERDQRNYLYGRDPNYATEVRDRVLERGQQNQADLTGIANDAQRRATGNAGMIGAYGQQQGAAISAYAPTAASYGSRAAAYGADAARRDAPTLDFDPQNRSLDQASARAGELSSLESTEGPSAAQAQLRSGLNQAQANLLSAARGGRGWGGGASALRTATNAGAMMSQQAANEAARLRASENAAWRSRQATNLGNAAAINQGVAGQQGQQAATRAGVELDNRKTNDAAMFTGTQAGVAGANTAAGIATQGASVGQAGLRDAAAVEAKGYDQQLAGTTAGMSQGWQGESAADVAMQRQNANDQAYETMLTQEEGIRNNLAIEGYRRDAQQDAATMQMAGTLLAASDERGKVKISSAAYGNPYGRTGSPVKKKSDESEVNPDFRDVENHAFVYRNPNAPGARSGPQVGLMAQDLERVLPSAVEDTRSGKMVDTGRVALALPGAIGDLQRRMDRLDGGAAAYMSDERNKSKVSGFRYSDFYRDTSKPVPSAALEHPQVTAPQGQSRYEQLASIPYNTTTATTSRFDQVDSIPYDTEAAGVKAQPKRSFARAAVTGALDTAALPVVAVGKAAEALGYPNAAANLSAEDATESLEWLTSRREPAEIRREERITQAAYPRAAEYGNLLGSMVGGAAQGALSARLTPTVGAVLNAIKRRPRKVEYPSHLTTDQRNEVLTTVFGRDMSSKDLSRLLGENKRIGGEIYVEPARTNGVNTVNVQLKDPRYRNRDEKHQLRVEREFTRSPEGELSVKHEYLTLPPKLEDRGIGSDLLRQQALRYRELGVARVETGATWDGRAVWPKLGYELADPAEFAALKAGAERFAGKPIAANNLRELAKTPEGNAYLRSDAAPGKIELVATPDSLLAALKRSEPTKDAARARIREADKGRDDVPMSIAAKRTPEQVIARHQRAQENAAASKENLAILKDEHRSVVDDEGPTLREPLEHIAAHKRALDDVLPVAKASLEEERNNLAAARSRGDAKEIAAAEEWYDGVASELKSVERQLPKHKANLDALERAVEDYRAAILSGSGDLKALGLAVRKAASRAHQSDPWEKTGLYSSQSRPKESLEDFTGSHGIPVSKIDPDGSYLGMATHGSRQEIDRARRVNLLRAQLLRRTQEKLPKGEP